MRGRLRRMGLLAALAGVLAVGCEKQTVKPNYPPDPVFVGKRPVGMIVAGYGISNELPFLAAMWVHPDFRRRRAGHALVLRALAFLRAAGQQQVALWVTETHLGVLEFYQSLGFRLTGARSPLRPGSETTILEMTLGLAVSLPSNHQVKS